MIAASENQLLFRTVFFSPFFYAMLSSASPMPQWSPALVVAFQPSPPQTSRTLPIRHPLRPHIPVSVPNGLKLCLGISLPVAIVLFVALFWLFCRLHMRLEAARTWTLGAQRRRAIVSEPSFVTDGSVESSAGTTVFIAASEEKPTVDSKLATVEHREKGMPRDD